MSERRDWVESESASDGDFSEAFDALLADDLERALRCLRLLMASTDHGAEAHAYIAVIERLHTTSRTARLFPSASERGPRMYIELAHQLADHTRFEVALGVLRGQRRELPGDSRVPAAIREVARDYYTWLATEVGDLDRIPQMVAPVSQRDATRWEDVIPLIDGRASCRDVVDECILGRIAAMQRVREMLLAGVVTLDEVEQPSRAHRKRRATLEFTLDPATQRVIDQEPDTPAPDTPAPDTAPSPSHPVAPADHGEGRRVGETRVLSESAPGGSSPGGSSPGASSPSAPESGSARSSRGASSDGFDELFAEATGAYLRRDYGSAVDLFSRCAQLRPGDTRVTHNLTQLRKRTSK